jgi:methylase of polypeptide subunit release factors
VDLRPYAFFDTRGAGEWWIASDLGELATGGALRTDHVLGVGGASVTLSGLLLPGPVDTALDLGTGCGIQALHLAREARRVVATDISQRALDLAALNAALNGVESIEFRLGSLFEPVAGSGSTAWCPTRRS